MAAPADPSRAPAHADEPWRYERQRHGISALRPDWSREAKRFGAWQPSRSLLASLRAYDRARNARGILAPWQRRWAVLRHAFWSVITGAEIPLGTSIGGGLLMPHPNGVVVNAGAQIGPNCLVFQQVTLGSDGRGAPRVGGHVDIGAGAKLLGPIVVGDHACIGANAVVLCDVPPGATAVGVPARIIPAREIAPNAEFSDREARP